VGERLTPKVLLEHVVRPRLKLLHHILNCEEGSLSVDGRIDVVARLRVGSGIEQYFFEITTKASEENVTIGVGLYRHRSSPIRPVEWLRRPDRCLFVGSSQAITLIENWLDDQIAECIHVYMQAAEVHVTDLQGS
jgi:hypothetical protein